MLRGSRLDEQSDWDEWHKGSAVVRGEHRAEAKLFIADGSLLIAPEGRRLRSG
jgi:hypothetical protein